jgi:uncharacterized protein YfaS (alpha-2-macroglobulin family)
MYLRSPLVRIIFGLFLSLVLFSACSTSGDRIEADPLFVQAHSFGEIATTSPVMVVFSKAVYDADSPPPEGNPFAFSPRVSGQVSWQNGSTVLFTPDEALTEGKRYQVRFDPAGLEGDLEAITGAAFSFEVVASTVQFAVEHTQIIAIDENAYQFRAEISSSEAVSLQALYNQIGLKLGRRSRDFEVTEDGGPTEFVLISEVFSLDDTPGQIALEIPQSALSPESGPLARELPSGDQLTLLSVSARNDDASYVELQFSHALDASQELRGLIDVYKNAEQKAEHLSFSVDRNIVRVHRQDKWEKEGRIAIQPGIRTSLPTVMGGQAASASFRFPSRKPVVNFLSDGVIIPTGDQAVLPIETVNLSAIMVEAIQIFPDNAHQFFQVNKYDGDAELARVGEVVWRDIIDLEWDDANVDQSVRYGLDLSPLSENFPGGFFHIRVTFRRPHIVYPCSGEFADEFVEFEGLSTEAEADSSYWDYWGSNNSYEYRRNRTNPCHPAYYQRWYDHNITIGRNVMVTDMGLIARRDQQGALHVFASDLQTARPMTNVDFTLYSFARNEIATGKTDIVGLGNARIENSQPFFIMAHKGENYGYLRVDDASAISTSHFDVAGVSSRSGLRGLIASERGVYRPGDDIHLTFILKGQNPLPDSTPVTFSLASPSGTVTDEQVLSGGIDGMYAVTSRTAADARTGEWYAKFAVGSTMFTRPVRIETVTPNRLKIELDLGGEVIYGPDISGTLHSEWLHGGRADGLRSEIFVALGQGGNPTVEYRDYTFTDPSRSFSSRNTRLFDGDLDRDGNADFDGRVNVSEAPGVLNATFTTRVYEDSGTYSSEFFTTTLHPYDRYVGLRTPPGDVARGMLLTDEDHPIDLLMVDNRGNPIRSASVTVELYKINWRWWWETDQEDLAGYFRNRSVRRLDTETVRISSGRGQYSLRVNYPEWGRYLLKVTDPSGGHSASKILYIDWPGWAGRGQDAGEGAAMLVLSSDKSEYEVGELVELTIPSGASGRAALSIESGGTLLLSEWVQTNEGTTRYRFRATEDMAPNAYVHVTMVQPYADRENDAPIRSYGVIPIRVEDPETRLQPTIGTVSSFQPNSDARILVTERNGRPMTYRLMMVDEGLLGLTRHGVPDVWEHFNQKQATGVMSFDYYNYMAGLYTGRLATMLAIGGGGANEDAQGGKSRARFTPVVEVSDPISLPAGGQYTHETPIGNYVGAVRIMVLAVSDTGFGQAESSVPVRSDLMVLSSLPRAMKMDEIAEIPVSVFVADESLRNVAVRLSTSGAFEPVGGFVATIPVDGAGDYTTTFEIKVDNPEAYGEIRVDASGGRHSSFHELTVPIERANPIVHRSDSLRIPAGSSESLVIPAVGIEGSNVIDLEISSIPPLDLSRRLGYLIRYPHGCIEQTTSSVFPQIYLSALQELSVARQQEIQNNVNAAIDRIAGFQTAAGGFSYWPNQTNAHEWGTNYAGHFLLEAREAGYPVPDGMIDAWVDYQSVKANQFLSSSTGDKEVQAYRLMTLALSGNPDIAAMNRLVNISNRSDSATLRLAYAFALSGYSNEARRLINETDFRFSSSISAQTFSSRLRDSAMALETLAETGQYTRADQLVEYITERLSSSDSLNTQETAFALVAMAKYASGSLGSNEKDVRVSFASQRAIRLAGAAPIISYSFDLGSLDSARIEIENDGSSTILPRLISSGSPEAGDEERIRTGLGLEVTYYGDENQRLSNINRVTQGSRITIEVEVTNLTSQTIEEVALTIPVPSGWQITNPRLAGQNSSVEFMDLRDTQANYYFDLPGRQGKTIKLTAIASFLGFYYAPAVHAGAMYDFSYQALEPGGWTRVVSP